MQEKRGGEGGLFNPTIYHTIMFTQGKNEIAPTTVANVPEFSTLVSKS